MTLKPCPRCGGAATIRTDFTGKLYATRAVCTNCGKKGVRSWDKNKPAAGAASKYWAGMSWNCGLYEQEV